MNFLLIVLLVGLTGATPVLVEPFADAAACEAKRVEVAKSIPRQQALDFVAVCARVQNSTELDV